MNDKVISEFSRIVGATQVITNIYKLIPYHLLAGGPRPLKKSDMMKVAVRPATSGEVSEIIKFANKEDIKISVRSGGTALSGHRPHSGEVVLDLSRMDTVSVNKKDGYAEVGPAATPVELNDVLVKYGYWFPAYPTCSERVAGIGGIISVNTSGDAFDPMLGKPGDYVSGLEVVLPTGEIIETGNKSIRRPAGPDLTRLFIGGEGLFGVITKIWLRLVPKPENQRWAVVVFQSLNDAAKAVQKIYYKGIHPIWAHFMDRKRCEACFKVVEIDVFKGPCVFIRTGGYTPQQAAWKMEKIFETCKEEKAVETRIIEESQWRRHLGPERAGEKIEFNKLDWTIIGDYVDPPLSKYAEIVNELQEKVSSTVGEDKFFVCIDAHGPLILWPDVWIRKDAWDSLSSENREKLKQMWTDYITAYGKSSIGFFPGYAECWKTLYGPTSYRLLKGLKKLFDPKNILNPTHLPEESNE
mgnify:CR=1 FL=1